MDAIIGRYQVGLKETGLILQHEAGIAFDLTREESLALFTLLHAYDETLLALKDGLEPEPEKVICVVIADAKEDEHA
jgi:hypothetical protein